VAADFSKRANQGYLIVKTFERLWGEFSRPWDGRGYVYGIPKKGVPASQAKKRYRGIDREPLEPYPDKDVEMLGELVAPRIEHDAQRKLADLESQQLVVQNFVQSSEDVKAVCSLLEQPDGFEVIWARDYLNDGPIPDATSLLGYEPSYLRPDHFSAVADCLFFPRWHRTDTQGSSSSGTSTHINDNGLFNSAAEALAFLDHYRSFDWTGNWLLGSNGSPSR
jgi:hypothetical protein